MPVKMPALFLAHGSPMNAVSQNHFTDSLQQLAKRIPVPKAIMVISAHWLTQGPRVTCGETPRTIHDFYGFPRELYQIDYPCPGSPHYSTVAKTLANKHHICCDDSWGIDHAAWSVLRHIYPHADIPVFELSLDYTQPAEYHYQLAKELAPLREQGVLCVGSGNIVHNLYQADFANFNAEPYAWAVEFDQAVKNSLLSANHKALVHYESLTKNAGLAVPTNEHYLPMLYSLALQEHGETLSFVYEGFQNASVSMRSFIIGEKAVFMAA